MCVIIEKQAGKEVPFEHLLAGASRNSDGYGVIIPDRGKFEIIRGLAGKPETAAKDVAKQLEKAKDNLAFVHFRLRTVGNVSIENVMPFSVYKQNGVELSFMHNGTLSGFRGVNESDSKLFCEQVITPLVRRSAALLGADAVASDPLIALILKEFAGSYSRFALVDSNGVSMVINRQLGQEQPYGWTSNSYSVDTKNLPSVITHGFVPRSSSSSTTKQTEHAALVTEINNAKRTQTASPVNGLAPSVRLTIKEILGVDTKAFCFLDGEQLREMVVDEPDLTVFLLLDLLADRYGAEFTQKAA